MTQDTQYELIYEAPESNGNESEILGMLCDALKLLPDDLNRRVRVLNKMKRLISDAGPFSAEPVDCVQWVPIDDVEANDYNPNSVAPPEMKLLEHSIISDGYTQPIVAWSNGDDYEVIDGFHRNRVARECAEVSARICGFLPLAIIRNDREDRSDRIAATIRHNRARGKHQVDSMSEIVVELKRRNWSDYRVGKELGMDPDEVLRLTQISGLTELFKDSEFVESWEPDNTEAMEGDNESLADEPIDLEWYTRPLDDDIKEGWLDRTEQSSVLYGPDREVYGNVQKSHVGPEWHWYSYTQPMSSGRSPDRDSAKSEVDAIWG